MLNTYSPTQLSTQLTVSQFKRLFPCRWGKVWRHQRGNQKQ